MVESPEELGSKSEIVSLYSDCGGLKNSDVGPISIPAVGGQSD